VGCGARAPQAELVRLVIAPDGSLVVVRGLRHHGRSGYLHRRPECWARFAARQGRVRSLGSAIDKATRNALVHELQQIEQVG
jgi:predicted RNA-binding protein YlxR (DUF448 family)